MIKTWNRLSREIPYSTLDLVFLYVALRLHENRCLQTCFVHCTTWHYRWPCWRMQSTSVYNRSAYCSSRKKRKKGAQHLQTIPKVYIVLRWQHQFWKTRSFYVHSDLILLWTITDSSEAPGKPPTRSYWVHPYPLRTPRLQHDVCKLLQPRSVVCLAYAYAFCYCLRRLSRYWLFFTMSILVRTRWSFFLPAWPGQRD